MISENIDTITALNDNQLDELFGDKSCRWYQIAARNQVELALAEGSTRICVVMPTGSGKTVTSGLIFSSPKIREILGVEEGKPLKLLFIAHKHILLSQAEKTYIDSENIELIVQSAFSSLPTDLEWDITCIDECHHEAMSTIQYHLEKLGGKPVIGLTATPDRADGCIIKFDEIINPISREQAVLEGWLAPTKIHSFIDVPSKDKINILQDMFENYAHQMGQAMVFVRTKREVKEVTMILKNMGYVAVGVLTQTEKELKVLLDQFSEGWVQFIVNCDRISEGVDVVGCTDVILGRQFGSYSQLNQVIGRASRNDSDCNVWELINPLSSTNMDSTVIVGTPESHRLIYKQSGKWKENIFDYTTHRTNKQLGIASGLRIR